MSTAFDQDSDEAHRIPNMIICDIENPTKRRRIFFDGSERQRRIVMEPGESLTNVALSEHVVILFRKREGDLRITEVRQVNPPAPRASRKKGDVDPTEQRA
jgi:hypothetical protein